LIFFLSEADFFNYSSSQRILLFFIKLTLTAVLFKSLAL